MRAPHGQYREYHTSADDPEFVTPAALAEALNVAARVADVLEHNVRYVNQNPKCEPQLGRRGLYRSLGGELDSASRELAMLWILNLSDGGATLLDIADRSRLRFETIKVAADALVGHGLLKPVIDSTPA
jgi:aminopeptidase-like protein